MKKGLIALVMISLLILVACESKTTGRRVAIPETTRAPGITGGAAADIPTPTAPTGETGKPAAEVLKELQTTGAITDDTKKSGTFYPPIVTTATGKDALAEKTDALLKQGGYVPKVEADKDFGARYHTSSGEPTNLPGNYSN